MRKIITTLIGIILLAGAVFLAKTLADSKQEPKPVERKVVTPVFTEKVLNESIPIVLTASGNLVAKHKVELYAEVTGIFESSSREFKPGSVYPKGSLLLRINAEEHQANLKAQRSTLYNQIIQFLPDLRLDYPDAFPKWESYLASFDVEKKVPPLPQPDTDKEKLFVTGKGIFSTYYNIKNLEERLSKYWITAPFTGVLTEALVNPGALVRNGQKLGEFINTGTYEMEVDVNVEYMDLMRVGRTVKLHDLERTKTWDGKVVRVNGRVDQSSQTIKVYIQVSGEMLKEGMYLVADLQAKEVENAYEIDRKLLFDENKLFVVRDTVLDIVEVEPVHMKEKTVLVRGLENGTLLMSRPVAGAYKGMKIEVIE